MAAFRAIPARAGWRGIEWSLADKPDAAIVEFGGNDALRGLAPSDTERNIGAILATLKARHIPVLLAGIKSPRNMGADYTKEFDAVFPALAKKYDVLFYPFFLDGVAVNPALNQRDGMHPDRQALPSSWRASCRWWCSWSQRQRCGSALMLGRLLSVGGFTALSRVAGFVRDILMAAILGAGPMSDAFFVAFRLPNNFRAIFAEGAFNAAFLPRYARRRRRDAPKAAAQFANDVFAWQMTVQMGSWWSRSPACAGSWRRWRPGSPTIRRRWSSRSISRASPFPI